MIETGDQQVGILKRIAASALFNLFAREQREAEAELLVHFILPLFDQTARGDDKHPPGIGPHQKFTDKQAGHDGLAGTGIIRENIP